MIRIHLHLHLPRISIVPIVADLELGSQRFLGLSEHGAHLRAHPAHPCIFLQLFSPYFVDKPLALLGQRALRQRILELARSFVLILGG